MSATAAFLATNERVQLALSLIQTALQFTAWEYPAPCNPANGSYSDYIVVGGGTAGSVVASRLSADSGLEVTILEAGGYPPLESELPFYVTYLSNSVHDFNFTTVDDVYSAQNLKNKNVKMFQGKMLGGTSSSNYMNYRQGNAFDYDEWAHITGDSSWKYENVIKYFRKAEKLLVPSILDSRYADYHGVDGLLKITKEFSSQNNNYFDALRELGNQIRTDLSGESSLGFSEFLFTIAEGKRQNSALAYLGDEVKKRPNLCVSLYSTVTKILITDGVATGVEMIDGNGNKKVLFANKEVIVSAGAINSPKLLMLSGIGDQSHLEELGIEVVSNLPVGENYQDHPLAMLVYQMEASTEVTPLRNPHMFPTPGHTGNVAIDSEQSVPDYFVFGLIYPHDSSRLLHLSSVTYSYNNDICDSFSAASSNRSIYAAVVLLAKPKSRGKVSLASADYRDDPIIQTEMFSVNSDLTTLARSLKDFNRILETSYFTSANASLVDPTGCDISSSDYWECFALAMSTGNFDLVGTCAMGSVLDSSLRVLGVSRLRVVDSSSIPVIPSAVSYSSVVMMAEKASEHILNDLYS